MPPKKKGGAKKGKSALSRKRAVKKDEDAASSVTGETTDDNASEAPSSPGGESVQSGKSGAGGRKVVEEFAAVTPPPGTSKKATKKVAKKEESEDDDKGWMDIPDLTAEFSQGEGKITYVTSSQKFREWEFEERRNLRDDYFDLETLKTTYETSLKCMRNLYPEVMNGKVCDAIAAVGYPTTLEELVGKLISLPAPPVPVINIQEPIFEESEPEEEVLGVPFSSNPKTRTFPSPSKMRKYQTPKNQGPIPIFKFGTAGNGLSTNKAPRLPKPGEVVFSQSGSPILQRRIVGNTSQSQPSERERVEVLQPDGTKLEVDIVYRGAPDGNKIRGFKEFARDCRGIAASRATSVRQNRIQPPKIGVKTGSQSATSKSKKPGWR